MVHWFNCTYVLTFYIFYIQVTVISSIVDAGIIASIGLDGSGYRELRRSLGLRAFALINGELLWVATQSGNAKQNF